MATVRQTILVSHRRLNRRPLRHRKVFSRIVFYPYKVGSESVRLLKEQVKLRTGLSVHRSWTPQSSPGIGPNSTVINWGNATQPIWRTPTRVFNHWNAVQVAHNKLLTLQELHAAGLSTVEFTTDPRVARDWLWERNIVLARQSLTGHSGEGIVILREPPEIVYAPMYTKYKPKKKEFRVHVFNGRVILVAEKRRDRDQDDVDDLIRSHDNGWVFCYNNVVVPDDVNSLSIQAIRVLQLDFGAVDIIWNQRDNRAYLLEVNTAPGLEGTSLDRYTRAILQL